MWAQIIGIPGRHVFKNLENMVFILGQWKETADGQGIQRKGWERTPGYLQWRPGKF